MAAPVALVTPLGEEFPRRWNSWKRLCNTLDAWFTMPPRWIVCAVLPWCPALHPYLGAPGFSFPELGTPRAYVYDDTNMARSWLTRCLSCHGLSGHRGFTIPGTTSPATVAASASPALPEGP